MGLETSSKRYAKALISYGIENDNLDILFDEIMSLIKTLEDSEDLRSFISNPTLCIIITISFNPKVRW